MDQIQIGRFIASERKAKSLTQRQLADMLSISDKTVSKWECGNGLPEVSLMLPLCGILDISVNELLTGERISSENYKDKAEENIMDLIKEKAESRRPSIALKIISAMLALFGIAAFSLPFASDMCIGLELALGTFWSPAAVEYLERYPDERPIFNVFLLIALSCGIAAIILLIKSHSGKELLFSGLVEAGGALSMALFAISIIPYYSIDTSNAVAVYVDWRIGTWLCLGTFAFAALFMLIAHAELSRPRYKCPNCGKALHYRHAHERSC